MTADAQTRKREKNRAYYTANRERLLERKHADYTAYPEHLRERSRARRAANPEKVRILNAAHYVANKEKMQKRGREKYAANPEKAREYTRAYRAANPEKIRGKWRAWRAANPDLIKAIKQTRRARLAQVETNFTAADWRAMLARSKRCHWCKRPWSKTRRPTHDHIIPISRGGPNTPENSVCACLACNSSKHARLVNPVTGQGILL